MVAIKKPLLSSNNKLKRLQFAKCYWNFQWDRILWSDEDEIELFGNKHQRWVWHRQKHIHAENDHILIVKYGGGSLFWACFISKGPGELVRIHGIMDSNKYQQILNQNLTASARKFKLGRGWIFQQDNDPKHTSNQHTLFTDHRTKVLPCHLSPLT
jgi:hypothetical protein